MNKISSLWEFRRDPRSMTGFMSTNRPSTDALNALEAWCTRGGHRKYVVKSENDDLLVAMLSTISADLEVGGDLDKECSRWGLIRERRQD